MSFLLVKSLGRRGLGVIGERWGRDLGGKVSCWLKWVIGPTDAEEVSQKRELEKKKRQVERRKAKGEVESEEMGLPPWV